jgi:hypothetical protein
MDEDKKITWSAFEYEWKERSVDWFWTVGTVAVVSLGLCIWLRATLFGIFIFLALGLLAYLAIRKPERLDVVIDKKGIQIGENMMLYKTIKSFWISETEKPALLLMTTRTFIPQTSIPIENVDTEYLKKFLLNFLKEVEMEESNSRKLIEKAGL